MEQLTIQSLRFLILGGWFWFSVLVSTCKYCYNQVISYCKFPKSAKFLSFLGHIQPTYRSWSLVCFVTIFCLLSTKI